MDMTESIAAKSDQLDAEDLLSGPRTFTITTVRKGPSTEQPVDIVLAEFPRPFRPSKTVRRILVAAWGVDASTYTGRQMVLYRDPAVRFGGMEVGGIRVSHLSHIDAPLHLALMASRGKRAAHTVQPLTAVERAAGLRAEWRTADSERRKVIEAEVAALTAPASRTQAPQSGHPAPPPAGDQTGPGVGTPGDERPTEAAPGGGGAAPTLPPSPVRGPVGGRDGDLPPIPPEHEPVTQAQLKLMHASLTRIGLGGNALRDQRLDAVSRIVGRTVTTTSDLTKQEATRVIDALGQVEDAEALTRLLDERTA